MESGERHYRPVPIRSFIFGCGFALCFVPRADAWGPYLVKDINPGPTSSLLPYFMRTDRDQKIYFRADDGIHGDELWMSDGTEAGTQMVIDFVPGSVGSEPDVLPCANGKAFFTVFVELGRADLYVSDGTAPGTQHLNAYMPYYGDSLTVGENLYFVGADPGNRFNDELWKSNGTLQGTQKVKEIAAGPLGSRPWLFTSIAEHLYFRTNGEDLWKSDGTNAGTILVEPGIRPFGMASANGLVFFRGANDSGNPPDYELWATTGVPGGTYRVQDIFPGPNGSEPASITGVGNRVHFTARRQIGGARELWVSDGTESGTVLVDGRGGLDLVNLNDELFFWRWDAISGYELWTSDGTNSGTVPVAWIAPPETAEEPDELIVVNHKLFFSADDGVHGKELWCYDPRFNTAFMVADLRPGPESGGPIVLNAVGTTLFFQEWTEDNGKELWAFDTREAVIPAVSTTGAMILLSSLLVAGVIIVKRTRPIEE